MKKLIIFLFFTALFFLVAKPTFAATAFRLEPASGTININETTPVRIVLNTGGASTGAISVILSFDSTKLSAGSSLTPGVFSLVLVNTVDNSLGRIRFDAGATTNQTGDGVTVATINFSGKAAGATEVTFSQARAVDAETNQYLDTSSTGGSYTVAAAAAEEEEEEETSPSPTPAASPSPSPSPASAEDLPETGILTPTLFLLGSGGVLLLFALLLI